MRSAHMPVAFPAAKDAMTAQASFRSSARLRTTLNLPSPNMKANAHKSWLALVLGNGSALRAACLMAFSVGSDGGGRSPELPTQSAHVVCGSQRLANNRDL